MSTAAPLPPGDLGRQVKRGLSWKTASQVVRQISRLVVIAVIARELSVGQYGLAGMVLVFSSLVIIFADLALGAALVQRRELSDADLSTVFWTSALTGLAFTLACLALAAPIAGFFGEPAVAPLLRVFSVTFVITALATVQSAMLARELRFRALELRSMAATLTSAVVGIGLALSGAGAWAIIGQQVAIAVVSTALVWVAVRWRPSFAFSWARLRDLGAFGLRVLGTRLLFYVERNVDNVLVGAVLGPAALGLYALSYNVMLVPLEQIGGPIADVLFPAFARVQEDLGRLRRAWLRAVRLMAAVVAPAMFLLIAVAPDIVPLIFGAHWAKAVPVIQVLAWVGLHQSLQRFNSSVLEALNCTKPLLRYALVTCAAALASFAIGLHWGVIGVAVAYAIASTLVAPMYLVVTARAAQMPVRDFLQAVGGVLAAAAVAGATAGALRAVLVNGAITGPVGRLLIVVPVGLAVYAALCRWWAPAVAVELSALMPAAARRRISSLRPGLRPAKA